ncbi:hypothetical protein [Chryseobacterium sp. T1]
MKLISIMFLLFFLASCNVNYKKNTMGDFVEARHKNIEFFEERRLNKDIELRDVLIINSIQGITELYARLENPRYSRSAPIPILEDSNEVFLVIKPILKDVLYGDIEIINIERLNDKLVVNYKEIENNEYRDEKLSHPIVIIKVKSNPKSVTLNKVK